jgi:hypothetical protein
VRIALAVAEYTKHPDNPKHELPTKLEDLLRPLFGGPSLLPNGSADLIDPWGKPYQSERARRSNGTEYLLIKTTTLNGRPISQFGIGSESSTDWIELQRAGAQK